MTTSLLILQLLIPQFSTANITTAIKRRTDVVEQIEVVRMQ